MSVSPTLVDTRPQPSKSYRWLVLIFVSLAMFGNYYVYDSINPLERIFLEAAELFCVHVRLVECQL